MKIQETDARAALMAWLDENKPRMQEPGEVSISDMRQHWNVGTKKAETMLNKLVEEGKMYCVESAMLRNGKRGKVYGRVK